MGDPNYDGGQVIVVVESPSAVASTQGSDFGKPMLKKISSGPEKKERKTISWELLQRLHSTQEFQNWLKKKEAAGMKYTKKRVATSAKGTIDYYGCIGAGCPVQLQVLFDCGSEDVVISYNGAQHKHKEKPHSGWGMPEKTKKEAEELFVSGITTTTEMDTRLRHLGHANYTIKQLATYMNRLRRMSRDQESVKAYTSLSLWGGRDRSSQDSRVPQGEAPSPPPADDAAFSDGSPAASPDRAEPTGDPDWHRQHRPAMDEDAVRRLVDSSVAARRFSYSPYSQFPVGAALLCADGTIITGCNVENASFGLTNCAERTAVYKAVSEGRRQFTAVAIAAEMGDKFVGPCGACRQVLAEFNPEMPVILAKPDGGTRRTNMKDLLPMAFLPDEVTFKKG